MFDAISKKAYVPVAEPSSGSLAEKPSYPGLVLGNSAYVEILPPRYRLDPECFIFSVWQVVEAFAFPV